MAVCTNAFLYEKEKRITTDKGGQAVSEYEHNEHLLDEIQRLRESNFHLRKDCEEQKQRIKQLETENDALRADLLLWNEKEVKL